MDFDLEALQREVDALAPAEAPAEPDDLDFEVVTYEPAAGAAPARSRFRQMAAGLVIAGAVIGLSRIGGCVNNLTDRTKPVIPTEIQEAVAKR